MTPALAEQLRYSSDILKPWKTWDLKDLVPGFFEAKPLAPDEYEAVLDKYRERRRAAAAAAAEAAAASKQQQQRANGHAGGDSRRPYSSRDERRDR